MGAVMPVWGAGGMLRFEFGKFSVQGLGFLYSTEILIWKLNCKLLFGASPPAHVYSYEVKYEEWHTNQTPNNNKHNSEQEHKIAEPPTADRGSTIQTNAEKETAKNKLYELLDEVNNGILKYNALYVNPAEHPPTAHPSTVFPFYSAYDIITNRITAEMYKQL